MESLRGLIGIIVLLLIAFIFSNNKRRINYRTIFAALVLQFIFGAIMLYVPSGKWVVHGIANVINKIISYSDAGASFIFGGLVSNKMNELFGSGGFVFALHVLPTIVFITALLSILYYIGIMRWIIHILGSIFQYLLGISKIESFTAVTTIFLGISEMPAAVKPFADKANKNEIFTFVCSGMASVAGSMFAGYAGLGVPIEYLLTASIMAIPSGIMFARILSPCLENSNIEFKELSFSETKPNGIVDAAASGALTGMKIAMAVGAVVMTFVGLIALIDGILSFVGHGFGIAHLSLESIFGYIFAPVAYIIGVPWHNATIAGSFIGQKLAINEFVAYLNLSPYIHHTASTVLDHKTLAIISFALCGFSNFGSIAVVVGGFSAISPNTAKMVAKFGFKALLAGTLSNLMSAAIAGIFIGFTG